MNAAIPAGCKKFHPAITPGTLFLLVVSLASASCTIIARNAGLPDFPRQLMAAGILISVSFALSVSMSIGFPAAFSADGIYSHSFWGNRRFVRWQHITKVRIFPMFNLLWLRIYADDGGVLWLPLFQRHRTEFRDEIRKHAPPDNPVLKFMASWPA
jgi:hypothetical protein